MPIPIVVPVILVAATAAVATAKISSTQSELSLLDSISSGSHPGAPQIRHRSKSLSDLHHAVHHPHHNTSVDNNLPAHYLKKRNVDNRIPMNRSVSHAIQSQFNHVRQRSAASSAPMTRSVSGGSNNGSSNTVTAGNISPGLKSPKSPGVGVAGRHSRHGSTSMTAAGGVPGGRGRHSRTSTQGRIRMNDARRHSSMN